MYVCACIYTRLGEGSLQAEVLALFVCVCVCDVCVWCLDFCMHVYIQYWVMAACRQECLHCLCVSECDVCVRCLDLCMHVHIQYWAMADAGRSACTVCVCV